MSFIRYIYFVIVLYTISFVCFYDTKYVTADQGCTENVCFRWAFGAVTGSKSERRLIEITSDSVLHSGDQFKMFVSIHKKCFVYWFYYSTQGQMYMLFPYNLDQFSTDYKLSKDYYLPAKNFMYELDNKIGEEKFYLLASAHRLLKLENLYVSYESANHLKKPEIARGILDEIRDLRRRHQNLLSKAERPVPVGGTVRGPSIKKETKPLDLNNMSVTFLRI